MKLGLLIMLLITLGVSSVYAADVVKVSKQDNAPVILNTVQSDSVQVLSKADAAKTRGEYYSCFYYQHNPANAQCHWETSRVRLPDYEDVHMGDTRRWTYFESDYWNYYVAR